MGAISINRNDDYACVDFSNGSFYYGYEVSKCLNCGKMNSSEYCSECEDADREWCFEAIINNKKTIIPFSDLGCNDMFDTVECLLIGIGRYMEIQNEK